MRRLQFLRLWLQLGRLLLTAKNRPYIETYSKALVILNKMLDLRSPLQSGPPVTADGAENLRKKFQVLKRWGIK